MYSAVTILGLVAFASAGLLPQQQPNNVYLPPTSSSLGVNAYSSSGFTRNIPAARQIAIVRQVNENQGDGSFVYSYETEDGQTAEARGQLQNDGAEGIQSTQGSYSFTAPDGLRYSVTYTAGLNGFEAQGAHLPVPPPIPEAIARALAENAADEARGIYDDGSYRGETVIGQRTSYQQGGQLTSQTGYQQGGQLTAQTGYQQGGQFAAQTGYQQRNQVTAQTSYQQGNQLSQTNYQQGGYQLPVPARQFRI